MAQIRTDLEMPPGDSEGSFFWKEKETFCKNLRPALEKKKHKKQEKMLDKVFQKRQPLSKALLPTVFHVGRRINQHLFC